MADNNIINIQTLLMNNNLLGKNFVTGMENPQTTEAIKELQAFLKVPVTGLYDPTTQDALNKVTKKDPEAIFKNFNKKKASIKQDFFKNKENVLPIQNTLIKYNIISEKDRTGIYDQKTYEAIKVLQKLLGLRATGFYDEALRIEINKKDKEIPNLIYKQYSDWGSAPQQLDVTALPANNSFLIFDGFHLSWISNGKIIKKWMALSGHQIGYKTVGKNKYEYFVPKEDYEKQKKQLGPLPVGRYGLGQIQSLKYKKTEYSVFDFLKYINRKLFYTEAEYHSVIDFKTAQKNILTRMAWGRFRIPILGTKFGRSRFYIHGGALVGSSGCIDLGDQGMENFAQTLTKTYGTKKHSLFLLVFYGLKVEEILKDNQLFSMLLNADTDAESDELIKMTNNFINKNKPEAPKETKKPTDMTHAERVAAHKSMGPIDKLKDEYGFLGQEISKRFKKLAGN